MKNNKSNLDLYRKPSKQIKLAVIMSIYKKTKHYEIVRAINSLEKQSKVKFDLLLHIDGDLNLSVEKFVTNYIPKGAIKNFVLSKSSFCLGLAASMNNLLLKNFNKYEYFARHDSDDYSAKKRLKIQLDYLDNHKDVDIVGTAFGTFEGKLKKSNDFSFFPESNKIISKAFAYSSPIAHATVLFRKSFFLKAGLYSPCHKTLAEDTRLWYSGFYTNCIFANIPKVLYFVSFDSLSYKRRSKIKQIFVIYKIRLRYIISRKLSKFMIIKATFEFFMRLTLAFLLAMNLNYLTKILIKHYQKKRNRKSNKIF